MNKDTTQPRESPRVFDRPHVYPIAESLYSVVVSGWGTASDGRRVYDVTVVDTREQPTDTLAPLCPCGSVCWVGRPGAKRSERAAWACGRCGRGMEADG